MKTLFSVTGVLFFAGVTTAQAFSAGDFSGWTRSTYFDRASTSWRPLSTTGNPPPGAEVSQTLSPVLGLGAVAAIALWDPANTWRPSSQGPIRSVVMQIDQRFDSGDPVSSQVVGAMVRQSNRNYVQVGVVMPITGTWGTVQIPPANEFDLVEILQDGSLDTNSHPDFGGSVLTFGFVVRSMSTFTPRTVVHHYDNWRLTLLPRGTFTPSGPGCNCGTRTPLIGSNGAPGLGFANFAITVGNAPPNSPGMLFVGLSDVWWGTTPLPFDMAPWGAPGCLLRVSPSLSVVALTDATGFASILFPIPASSVFVNAQFCGQWFILAPGANPLGICVSSMGLGTID